MPAFDGLSFGKEMVTVVKSYVAKSLKPITDQLDALAKEIADQSYGQQLDELRLAVKTLSDTNAALHQQIADLNSAPLIAQSVHEATTNALKGWNDDVRPTLPTLDTVKGLLGDAVRTLREEVLTELTPLVETAARSTARESVADFPLPKDGVSGRGIADVQIDEKGMLVLFFTDATKSVVGKIVGNLMTPEDIVEVVNDAFEERDAKTTAELEKLAKEVAETAELVSAGSTSIPELVSSAVAQVKSEIVLPEPIAVIKATIGENTGFLNFELSNGKSITIGTDIRGKDGKDGKDGENYILEPNELSEIISGHVKAELGHNAEQYRGLPGQDAEPVDVDVLVERVTAQLVQPTKQMIIDHLEANVDKYRGLPGEPGKDAVIDTDALAEHISSAVESFVTERAADFKGAPGEPGADAVIDEEKLESTVLKAVHGFIAANGDQFKGAPGEDAKFDYDALTQSVVSYVSEYFETNAGQFKGEPGKAADPIDMVMVSEIIVDTIEGRFKEMAPNLKGAPGEPGKDADPELIKTVVADTVVAEFEARKEELRGPPGESVKGDPGRDAPPVEEIAAAAAKLIPVPKDGIGLAGALINREGELVVTLTNGEAKELGPVVGKDGSDVDPEFIKTLVQEKVDALPKPKDGVDGVNFDDMDIVLDWDSKELVISASHGENAKQWKFFVPFLIDKGVYKEGTDYLQGDGTTFAGCFWIAQKETNQKPGTGDDWRMSVKKGRDGKDGVVLGPKTPVELKRQ